MFVYVPFFLFFSQSVCVVAARKWNSIQKTVVLSRKDGKKFKKIASLRAPKRYKHALFNWMNTFYFIRCYLICMPEVTSTQMLLRLLMKSCTEWTQKKNKTKRKLFVLFSFIAILKCDGVDFIFFFSFYGSKKYIRFGLKLNGNWASTRMFRLYIPSLRNVQFSIFEEKFVIVELKYSEHRSLNRPT